MFVLNNADREDFSVENYRAMQEVIMKIFEKSKLKFTGKCFLIHIKTTGKKTEPEIWSEKRNVNQI